MLSAKEPGEGTPVNYALMIKCCMSTFIDQIPYSILESVGTPFMIDHGLSQYQAALIPFLTPMCTLFLHPVLGAWSDNCKSILGRRKPFILAFSLGAMLSILIIAFCPLIESSYITVVFILAAMSANICSEMLSVPSRALLNDVLSVKIQRKVTHFMPPCVQ